MHMSSNLQEKYIYITTCCYAYIGLLTPLVPVLSPSSYPSFTKRKKEKNRWGNICRMMRYVTFIAVKWCPYVTLLCTQALPPIMCYNNCLFFSPRRLFIYRLIYSVSSEYFFYIIQPTYQPSIFTKPSHILLLNKRTQDKIRFDYTSAQSCQYF